MRRQLLKLMLPAEAARSVMLWTAAELAKADAGDEAARRRVRLLTPLLKFRACRDARRVTGDAMEVRGGVGYTEEWPDARLLRDAHLGSIWEGTSNIVALDVLRAIRREDALEALEPALEALLPRGRLRRGAGPRARARVPVRRRRGRSQRAPGRHRAVLRRRGGDHGAAKASGSARRATRAASCSPCSPCATGSRRASRSSRRTTTPWPRRCCRKHRSHPRPYRH